MLLPITKDDKTPIVLKTIICFKFQILASNHGKHSEVKVQCNFIINFAFYYHTLSLPPNLDIFIIFPFHNLQIYRIPIFAHEGKPHYSNKSSRRWCRKTNKPFIPSKFFCWNMIILTKEYFLINHLRSCDYLIIKRISLKILDRCIFFITISITIFY